MNCLYFSPVCSWCVAGSGAELSQVSILSNLLQLIWFPLCIDLTRFLLLLILLPVHRAENEALLSLAFKTSPETFWAVSSSAHSHQWQAETLPLVHPPVPPKVVRDLNIQNYRIWTWIYAQRNVSLSKNWQNMCSSQCLSLNILVIYSLKCHKP